ncbi:MAG TPA: hypothetical protein VMS78_12575 [Rhizomicrobium sp.]|nr:hypothetical protein [Rhizomicrobium sp.]
MAEQKSPAEMYHDLRAMAFGVTAEQLGLHPSSERVSPFGIIMEMGLSKGTVTVVSFVTGDASIYLSSGGGMIGGSGHESVRAAAKQFVSASNGYVTRLKRVSDFPRPSAGNVIFYVLTNKGTLRSDELAEDDLGHRRSEFSSLFYAGQDVITQLRLVTPP